MQKQTKQDYLRLAQHFFETRFFEREITPKSITDALIYCAHEYRPAYWRRLRKALELHQLEKGFKKSAERIAKTINPLTKIDEISGKQKHKSKQKQKRVKSVSESEYQTIIKYCEQHNDFPCIAAVTIAYHLGCRPAEMPHLEFLDNNVIYIPSAKQTQERGLNRKLIVPEKIYEALQLAHSCLTHDEQGKTTDISRIQRRLQRHVKNIWSQRKAQISLYSFRHQMGSDLKASGLNDAEVAAIMGHLSTESVNAYGNRRKAKRAIVIKATQDTLDKIRVKDSKIRLRI